ncbi:MAG: hypothetical protein AAF585_10885 [Verrucomicrobiota bacterium]
MKTPAKLWLLPLALLPFLFVSCTESDEEPQEPEPEPAAADPDAGQAKGQEKGKGKGKGGRGGIADQLLGEYDADADGAISDYEVDEATWKFIERADENKDAKVTREEFANLRPPAPEGGQGAGGEDGKGKGGGGKGGRPDPAEMFSRMDANGDGKISSDEAPEFIWERMSAADANGDGAVTIEEMQARRAARDAERAAGGGGGFDGKGRGGKGGKGEGGGKGGGKGGETQ